MARKSTKELINETKLGFNKLENQLTAILLFRDTKRKELANARRRLTRKKNSAYPDKLFEEIRAQLLATDVMRNSLIFAIDRAAEQNTEFQEGAYLKALYTVAEDKDIYKLFKVGAGWSSHLSVQIIFEEEAGNLADWARGINLVRDELGVEPKDGRHRAGFKATMFWIDKIFGTSRETRTIKMRLDFSGRKAPFWQILNNGSQPLDSDRRDGSFNPLPASPTDFIGDAEASIRRFFLVTWLPEKNKWLEETIELERIIENIQNNLDRMEEDLNQLSTDLAQNERVYRSFGEKRRFIDKNKLAEILERLRAGEEFERNIRVELTASGSGGFRIRPTVRKLEGLLDE